METGGSVPAVRLPTRSARQACSFWRDEESDKQE
jgi:hypothetical protein